jgi:hypothetical protein
MGNMFGCHDDDDDYYLLSHGYCRLIPSKEGVNAPVLYMVKDWTVRQVPPAPIVLSCFLIFAW